MRGSRLQAAVSSKQRAGDQTTGAADSRTGGRKKKTRVDSSGGASGVRRFRSGVPPLPVIPTRSRLRECYSSSEKRGRLWQSRSLVAISGKRNLQRMRGEFLGTPPPLSLVKAQPHPPTLLFMVLAISENHVSTATAQQSVAFSAADFAATATATADSGSGSQGEASSDRS